MARPRTPNAVAKMTGRALHDPARFTARSEPKVQAIGKPPEHLTETEAEAWAMFADELPWLANSDRAIVEIASRLRARMMTNPDMGVNATAQFRMCLQAMGATPSDRTKVTVPDEDEDPTSKFFN